MREIKFRAWEKHTQTMTRPWDLGEIIERAAMWCNNPYWEDPVMQYTGLKDKNGVEIYEGDRVLIDEDWDYAAIGIVTWLQDECEFRLCFKGSADGLYLCDTDFYEVIGNIYENKELLNGD